MQKVLKKQSKSFKDSQSATFGLEFKHLNKIDKLKKKGNLNLKEPKSFEINESIESSSAWEDPTDYWRAAQSLGDTIRVKDHRYR